MFWRGVAVLGLFLGAQVVAAGAMLLAGSGWGLLSPPASGGLLAGILIGLAGLGAALAFLATALGRRPLLAAPLLLAAATALLLLLP